MQLQVRKRIEELTTKLKVIWDNPAFEPVRYPQQTTPYVKKGFFKRNVTNFGDDQLRIHKVLAGMIVRMVLVLPIGAVGIVLCVTVIGLPLGIPIMMWVGAFCSKPIRKHPAFNIEAAMAEAEIEDDWSY